MKKKELRKKYKRALKRLRKADARTHKLVIKLHEIFELWIQCDEKHRDLLESMSMYTPSKPVPRPPPPYKSDAYFELVGGNPDNAEINGSGE